MFKYEPIMDDYFIGIRASGFEGFVDVERSPTPFRSNRFIDSMSSSSGGLRSMTNRDLYSESSAKGYDKIVKMLNVFHKTIAEEGQAGLPEFQKCTVDEVIS